MVLLQQRSDLANNLPSDTFQMSQAEHLGQNILSYFTGFN